MEQLDEIWWQPKETSDSPGHRVGENYVGAYSGTNGVQVFLKVWYF